MSTKEEKIIERLVRYRKNLQVFAMDCLTIRDKDGNVFTLPGLNTAQRYVHKRIQEQKAETGKVRALILKGRQQGISTYVAARFYRQASLNKGVNVYILSHEQTATDNLFKIVERFQINNPVAPLTGKSNAKELEFPKLDSSYIVATAGQKGGGRSRTISLFHGSEVHFWQNAKDHFAASVQTVPDLPGTEIILESTGNGPAGEFYERWHDAVAGVGDYQAIFVPWFWQKEYEREPGKDFVLSEEPGDNGISEKEYAEMFSLSDRQMAWRRAKVSELRSVRLFDQEYPATPALAFTSADMSEAYIQPIVLLRARKRVGVVGAGPNILGIDPSGPGKDRFVVAHRQGLKIHKFYRRNVPETPEAVLWVKKLIDDILPDRAYIDLGNIGHAVYTTLRALEGPARDRKRYLRILRGVNFGSTSQFKTATPKAPGPKNRRAEMWKRLKEWLELQEGVSVPDDDSFQADATAVKVKPQLNNDFYLESKKDVKARLGRSPDDGDAAALTFAEEGITWTDEERADGRDKKAQEQLEASAAAKKPGDPLDSKKIQEQEKSHTAYEDPFERYIGAYGGADGWMS